VRIDPAWQLQPVGQGDQQASLHSASRAVVIRPTRCLSRQRREDLPTVRRPLRIAGAASASPGFAEADLF
jgi:hypothetical protein